MSLRTVPEEMRPGVLYRKYRVRKRGVATSPDAVQGRSDARVKHIPMMTPFSDVPDDIKEV